MQTGDIVALTKSKLGPLTGAAGGREVVEGMAVCEGIAAD